jgi:hypothetical protein
MKLFWLIFLCSFLGHVNAQQPNKALIEGNLKKIITNFMQIETNLNKRMSTFGLQLFYCDSNLRASNLPTNFTDTLQSFMSAIKAVQYMQNHQVADLSNKNMSNFDYTMIRTMTLPTDIKLYSSIIAQLQTNGKMIQTYLRNITKHYKRNFRTLVKIPSKNKLILATIREAIGISINFGAYIRLLKIRSAYLAKLNAYLNALINKKIVIPPANVVLDPFMAKLKETEDKLAPNQAVTANASLNALAKIAVAQKTVQKSVRSSSEVSELMQSMKGTFTEISLTDDFPKLAWPKFPDIPGDSTIIKLRANLCEGREQKFKDIEEKNKQRKEKIKANREALNAMTLSASGSKKVQASQAILDVIEATKSIEASFDGYKAGISQASTGMTQIREVFVPTTTTTSTTMRIPVTKPTTTKIPATTTTTSIKIASTTVSMTTTKLLSTTVPPTTSSTTVPPSSTTSTSTLPPTTTTTTSTTTPVTTTTIPETTTTTLATTTTTLVTTTTTSTKVPSITSTTPTTTTTMSTSTTTTPVTITTIPETTTTTLATTTTTSTSTTTTLKPTTTTTILTTTAPPCGKILKTRKCSKSWKSF